MNRRERKIRRLEDRIADLRAYLAKWGWSERPSSRRRLREDLDRLEAKLSALLGEEETK